MAEPLTPIERKVYQYLIDFLAENTYQPSIREIGSRFRIKSTKTVSDLLHALTEKGYIERDPARSRGVRIIGHQGPAGIQPLPYYGRVHAGEPSLLAEHKLGSLTFDRRFVASDHTFVLRVTGDSMIGRGIHDGDYVLVTPTAQPNDGDVVAARIGEEATIKSYEKLVDGIVLHPANPADREIRLRPTDDYSILGLVTGVFRPSVERDVFEGAVAT
ncbi:LexA repressor [Gemmatimonadetes bacterium T265]|nr:LexA repressor [Gemmatimonadetes bacterium T265]